MPGTINTKAKKVVRIVQGMGCLMDMSVANRSCAPPFIANESWGRPTTQFLNDFHAYLVQQQINDKITKSDRRLKQMYFVTDISSNKSHDHGIWWIDKLLQIGVEDYRKDLLYWVLAPYLITVRKMDHDKATAVLEEWLEKCNAIRSLQPGWSYFRYRINYCIDNAYRNERLPIKFQTFQEYYPDLI